MMHMQAYENTGPARCGDQNNWLPSSLREITL